MVDLSPVQAAFCGGSQAEASHVTGGVEPRPHDAALVLRAPTVEDAPAVWRLVRASRVLDLNSPYAYLLLCSDFAETCVVAEERQRPVGFVAGYRPPSRPDMVFVWQIVAESQGGGIGSRLLDALLARPACRGVRFLEATVTPSNRASRALFEGLARRQRVPCLEQPGFAARLFPDSGHEEEVRLRIGPLIHPASQGRSPE